MGQGGFLTCLIPPEVRANTLARLERAWRDVLKPPEKIDPCEWIEQNIILTRTEKQGYVRLDNVPYAREVIRTILPDDPTEIITLCWGSQLTKTTTLSEIGAFAVRCLSQQVLWATSTLDHAEKFVHERLNPLIEECEALKELLVEDSILTKRFRHCSWHIIGGMHERQIKQLSASVIFGDEIDSWGNKGAVFAQLKERGKGYTRPKLYQASTPNLENGPVWTNYLEGSQETYWCECRNCHEAQELVFENLIFKEAKNEDGTWNKQKAREIARYRCPFCGFEHYEKHKHDMLMSGNWVAQHPEITTHRSFRLSSLYSPFYSWNRMAYDYTSALGSPEKTNAFRCGYLAEPWRIFQVENLGNRILNKCAEYDRGTLPCVPVAVCLSADYGLKRLHWVITAFGSNGAAYVIDYGTVPTLDQLVPIAEGDVDGYPITHVGVDANYNTEQVTEFCHDHGWWPIHGNTRIHSSYQFNEQTGHLNLHTDMLKDMLEDRIEAPQGKWHIFRDDGQMGDFVMQMSSEKREMEVDADGFARRVWNSTNRPNHYWDCTVYGMGMCEAFRLRYLHHMAAPNRPEQKQPAKTPEPPVYDHFSVLDKYSRA